jgi:hypothetical protein
MKKTSVYAAVSLLSALFLGSACSSPIVDSPIHFQISGTVRWESTKEPVPDAKVEVRTYIGGEFKASGVTDANGFYSLDFVAYGNSLKILVWVNGKDWVFYWRIKETGDPQTVDLLLD